MTGNVVTNAFHGTSRVNAKKILKEGFRFEEKNTAQLLGDGVYFYLGSPSACAEFVREHRSHFKQIAVLQSTINMAFCLDLDVEEHRDILELIEDELQENQPDKRITLPLAIDFLAGITRIDCVKKTVELARNVIHFRGSPMFSSTRTTIAVRNTATISKTKLNSL